MDRKLTSREIRQQIVLQNKLYASLKRWLVYSMLLSTLMLSFLLILHWNKILFIVLFALCVTASFTIGLSVKRGQDNLKKLFQLLDQTSQSAA